MPIASPASLMTSVAFVSIFAAAAHADEAKLRYTYPSEPVLYRIVVKSESEMSGGFFGPKGMKGGLATAALCQFKKVGTDGDSSTVELVYKGIKFRQDSPGGKSVFFDTSAPEFHDAKPEQMDAMSKLMACVVDKPILLTIDPRGQITKVENMKPIRDALKAAGASDPLGEATVESVIKEQRITRTLRSLLVTMPEEAVKKGSTWSASVTDTEELVGTIKQTTAWTHAGDETLGKETVVHLTGASTVEAVEDKAKESKRPKGSKLEIDSKEAKGSSDVLFDAKAGLVKTATASSNVPISMSFNAENQAFAMKVRFSGNSSATRVDAGAPLDPDNAVTKPEASATKRSTDTGMKPVTEPGPKADH